MKKNISNDNDIFEAVMRDVLKQLSEREANEAMKHATEHNFSRRFKENMNKILNADRKKKISASCIRVLKATAMFVFAFFIVGVSSMVNVDYSAEFSGLRDPEVTDEGLEFYIDENVHAEAYKQRIDKIYCLTEVPDLYMPDESYASAYNVYMGYRSENNDHIHFSYGILGNYGFTLTGTDEFERVNIDGTEAIYVEGKDESDMNLLVWSDGEYLFDLFSTCDYETLVELKNSVEEVELSEDILQEVFNEEMG